MSYGRLAPVTPEALPTWASNDEIIDAWARDLAKWNRAPNTIASYTTSARLLADAYEPMLLTELKDLDIQQYISEVVAVKCPNLQRMRSGGYACRHGHDIANCPVIHDAVALECMHRDYMEPESQLTHMNGIVQFYAWLIRTGHLTHNPVVGPKKQLAAVTKRPRTRKAREPVTRAVTTDEVRTLIQGSAPQHGIIYALCALCGTRLHEAVQIRVSGIDWERGTFTIPGSPEYGQRRVGCPEVGMTSEMRQLTQQFLSIREGLLRGPCDVLAVNERGVPWSPANFGKNIARQLHEGCKRLKLMTGEETKKKDRINTHCFRGYFTTHIREQEVPSSVEQVMRGDTPYGSIRHYDHYRKRVPGLWQKYGPRLDL